MRGFLGRKRSGPLDLLDLTVEIGALVQDPRPMGLINRWSAITCDVNRASVVGGRPLLAMIIEQV